jgi:pimeloyl-ACP methyl ester carboxylesterase
MTMFKTVSALGLQVFYREAGNPDRPKLLLLGGFPSSSHQFRNLLPALADRSSPRRSSSGARATSSSAPRAERPTCGTCRTRRWSGSTRAILPSRTISRRSPPGSKASTTSRPGDAEGAMQGGVPVSDEPL